MDRCSIQRCCLVGKLVLGGEDCPFSVLLWAMQSGESLLSAVHLHCVGVVIPCFAMCLPLWVSQLGHSNSGPALPLQLSSQGPMPEYDCTEHFVFCLLSMVLLAGQPVQVIRGWYVAATTLHAVDQAKNCLCTMNASRAVSVQDNCSLL